MVTEYISQTFE